MTHHVKILHSYFVDICKGKKNFELRKDDRNYNVGDFVNLFEIDETGKETGNYKSVRIKYILRDVPHYGLMNGFCIFGF